MLYKNSISITYSPRSRIRYKTYDSTTDCDLADGEYGPEVSNIHGSFYRFDALRLNSKIGEGMIIGVSLDISLGFPREYLYNRLTRDLWGWAIWI